MSSKRTKADSPDVMKPTKTSASDDAGQQREDYATDQVGTKKRRSFRMPHIYVILFVLSAVAALSTYFIPSYSFDRVEGPDGREIIDPNTLTAVDAAPTTFLEFITAIPRGLVDAGEVVFFTFIIGGVFMVVRHTGIIENALDRVIRVFHRRKIFIIPALISLFAVLASVIGTQELALVYIPVLIPVIIALGYDSLTAVAIALIGTCAGFSAGVFNPINTGLAQQISDVETFSGAGMRALVLLVFVTLGSLWTMWYARRVSLDPAKSLSHDEPGEAEKREQYKEDLHAEPKRMSGPQKTSLLLCIPVVAVMIWGISAMGWFMLEMAGMFLLIMLIIGLISGLRPSQIADSFSEGMRSVLEAAIIVGMARSVAVIMEDGQILDSIVSALGGVVSGLPAILAAIGMLIVQALFNFIVPSGSGQAVVTMPIMAPLADMLDVTRQTAVLAFQLGDGPSNLVYPTSGYFMAALAIGGVRWERWIRFFLPLFLMWFVTASIFLITAQATNWS